MGRTLDHRGNQQELFSRPSVGQRQSRSNERAAFQPKAVLRRRSGTCQKLPFIALRRDASSSPWENFDEPNTYLSTSIAAVTTNSTRTPCPRSLTPIVARAGACSGAKKPLQISLKASLSSRSDK